MRKRHALHTSLNTSGVRAERQRDPLFISHREKSSINSTEHHASRIEPLLPLGFAIDRLTETDARNEAHETVSASIKPLFRIGKIIANPMDFRAIVFVNVC